MTSIALLKVFVLAIVIVLVITIASPPRVETSYATRTSTYTTIVYKNIEMVGMCIAISYIIPDTEEVSVTNIT